MVIVAVRAAAGIDVQCTNFVCFRVVVIDNRRKTELIVRRPEHRIALEQNPRDDDVLVERQLLRITENAERGRLPSLQTNWRRNLARLKD